MPTPHKHAAVIKAWADGAEVQWKYPHELDWKNSTFPSWDARAEYRVKPKAEKYRVGLWKSGMVGATHQPDAATIWESSPAFVRWLTDWVEYE